MIRLISLFLMVCSVGFATNGGTVIGAGPRSTAMGGTGVAHSDGHLDAMYKNPSLLTEKAGPGSVNIEAAATYLSLSVTGAAVTPLAASTGSAESKAKGKFIPDLAGSYRVNDSMTLGLGVIPVAGAAFDFEGSAPLAGLKVEHTVIRFQPSLAMTPFENFSFGVAPIIGYGELAINSAASGTQSAHPKASGVGFSGQVGASYKIDQLLIGTSYTHTLKVNHKAVTDVDLFGPDAGAATAAADDLALTQPAEIAVGVGYAVTPEWSVTVDYRNIGWSHANIYENLGWQSQNVIAFGTQYRIDKLALRAGFNYAKSPVEDIAGETGLNTITLDGHRMYASSASLLNVNGFPPAAQTHITLGGGYDVSDSFGFDLAFIFVPKKTISRAGTTTSAAATYAYASESGQFSVTGGLRFGL